MNHIKAGLQEFESSGGAGVLVFSGFVFFQTHAVVVSSIANSSTTSTEAQRNETRPPSRRGNHIE